MLQVRTLNESHNDNNNNNYGKRLSRRSAETLKTHQTSDNEQIAASGGNIQKWSSVVVVVCLRAARKPS
jgi:hypothetical protein